MGMRERRDRGERTALVRPCSMGVRRSSLPSGSLARSRKPRKKPCCVVAVTVQQVLQLIGPFALCFGPMLCARASTRARPFLLPLARAEEDRDGSKNRFMEVLAPLFPFSLPFLLSSPGGLGEGKEEERQWVRPPGRECEQKMCQACCTN